MKITRLIPVLLVSAPMASHAGGLGIQANTSFVYGNATVGEVHGGLFVGGNLTDTTSNQLGNEFVNDSNHDLDVMRVGGALNWASGQSVKDGNVKVTGSENLTSQQIDNGYALTQNYNFGNYFSSEQSNLLALSAAYAGLSSSGLTSNGGTVNISPVGTGVFAYNFDSVIGASLINITATAGSTIILNVDKSSVALGAINGVNFSGGITEANVIWNFSSTANGSSLSFSGGLRGSVLAPDYAVSLNNGNLYGQLAASSLNLGAGEIHAQDGGGSTDFSGFTPGATPEPVTILVGGAGLFLAFKRRQSHRA